MFSATQTRNVEDLARVSLKKSPLYVGVDDHRETSTVEGLEQVEIMYLILFCYVQVCFNCVLNSDLNQCSVVTSCLFYNTGIHCGSLREAFPGVVHFPQEEQK